MTKKTYKNKLTELAMLLIEVFEVDHVAEVLATWNVYFKTEFETAGFCPIRSAEILFILAATRPGFVEKDIKGLLNFELVNKAGFIASRLENPKPEPGQDIRKLEFVEISPSHVLFQYEKERVLTGTMLAGRAQNITRLSGDFFRDYFIQTNND